MKALTGPARASRDHSHAPHASLLPYINSQMRAAFSNCPGLHKSDKSEMQPTKLQSCEEEGLAFIPGKNAKHQIIYASTTEPQHYIPGKRNRLCNAQVICAILIASVLASGLIALELYRSTEILRLREETDQLRVDFETFKHRILEDDLLEAIRAFEQQSYKDDQESASTKSTSSQTADENSSLSDDDDDLDNYYDDNYTDDDDDDDLPEDEDNNEDNTQGKRRRREVELQPPVVARRPLLLGRTEDGVPVLSHSYAAIKELNRTGALTSLRLYDTLGKPDDSSTTTEDPIKLHHRVSPLWVPKKWKKQGVEKASYHKRRSPTVTSAPWPVIQRHSRVMQTPEEGESISTTYAKDTVIPASNLRGPPQGEIVMRVIQPNSGEQAPQASEVQPPIFRAHAGAHLRSHDPSNPAGDVVRPRRNRRKHRPGMRQHIRTPEGMEMEGGVGPRRLAAHYGANSTMYIMGHPHFAGNGRLRHPGVFSDWSPSSWMKDIGMDHHFVLSEGVLTVRQPGLYFFYSQIYYIDDHDNNGYNVYVNDAIRLQCTTMTHSSSAVTKINTCYTGGVMMLQAGDTIYLRDIAGLRYSLFEPDKSFFGLFRLNEGRIR